MFLQGLAKNALASLRDGEAKKLGVVVTYFKQAYPDAPLPTYFDDGDGKVPTGVTVADMSAIRLPEAAEGKEDSIINKLAHDAIKLIIDYQENPQCPKRNVFNENKLWDDVTMLVLEELKHWIRSSLFNAAGSKDDIDRVRARIQFMANLEQHADAIFLMSNQSGATNESAVTIIRHVKSFLLEDRVVPQMIFRVDERLRKEREAHEEKEAASTPPVQAETMYVDIKFERVHISIPSINKFLKVSTEQKVAFVDDVNQATEFRVDRRKAKAGHNIYGLCNEKKGKFLFHAMPATALFHCQYGGDLLYCPYSGFRNGEEFVFFQDEHSSFSMGHEGIFMHVGSKKFWGINSTGEYVKILKTREQAEVFRLTKISTATR